MLAATLSRTQPSRPRPVAFAAFAVALVWLAASFAPAQERTEKEEATPKPTKKVEVEEDAPKPPKKVEVEGDPPGTTTPPPKDPAAPGNPADTTPPPATEPEKEVSIDRSAELARAATSARYPALRTFLNDYVVAFDRLTELPKKVTRIAPVPLLWGKDKFPPGFGVAELGADGQPGEARESNPRAVRKVEPFERVAVADVDLLLAPPAAGTPPPADAPPPAEKLAAAEMVLARVLFFHDLAREQNKRRGKNWDPVKQEVYDRLTRVRVDRVRQAGIDKDWAKLKELSHRLIQLYKGNPKVLEPVYAARLAEADALVQSSKVADLERGRELLNEYDARFPNTGNEAAKKVRQLLADRAKKFLTDADRMVGQDNKTEARNILRTVEAIDPENPSLRQLQQQLKTGYPVLVVGTARLPERMSPGTARFDSEHQAAELMFEGLTEAIPDEQVGVRFLPSLAAERPAVGAGVRDVQLVRSAAWAGPDGGVFDATDVAGTIRLERQGPGTWAADAVNWLDDPWFDPSDPGRVRLRFRLGHPDPRGLLTLKMLPANWLLQRNKGADDQEFARRPFGTGPFKLAADFRPRTPADPPRDVVFVANPAYGRRPGKMGQPFVKEVRFVDVAPVTDLPAEFRGDRLHVLTDVPTADLPKYEANNGLSGRVRVVTAANERRVHVLAVNHRRPALQSPDLRRGLSHAVDREKVLTDVYRAGRADAHKAMTGPFPPGSWATPRSSVGPSAALFNRDVAQAKFKQYLSQPQSAATLSLCFAADDPQARSACDRIKYMVEAATASEERKLTIGLEPLPPGELYKRVTEDHTYDLAYLPFDYPNDWYPQALGSFLDPSATAAGGRNYLGYRAKGVALAPEDDRLARQLDEARLYRDPEGKLAPLAHALHRQFNDAVPFVPLWQLDRHAVVSTAVKVWLDGQVDEANPRLLCPTTLFNSVGRWRVE